jgi:hypothetical protein
MVALAGREAIDARDVLRNTSSWPRNIPRIPPSHLVLARAKLSPMILVNVH